MFTGICLVTPDHTIPPEIGETRVRFKPLSKVEIESYLASGQWRGKAGGYAIQETRRTFVVNAGGDSLHQLWFGLPLYETVGLLTGEGYDVHFKWLEG